MLTPEKELMILQSLAEGDRLVEVCSAMGITQTQYYHLLSLIKAKYGAVNANNLVAIALRKKIIE